MLQSTDVEVQLCEHVKTMIYSKHERPRVPPELRPAFDIFSDSDTVERYLGKMVRCQDVDDDEEPRKKTSVGIFNMKDFEKKFDVSIRTSPTVRGKEVWYFRRVVDIHTLNLTIDGEVGAAAARKAQTYEAYEAMNVLLKVGDDEVDSGSLLRNAKSLNVAHTATTVQQIPLRHHNTPIHSKGVPYPQSDGNLESVANCSNKSQRHTSSVGEFSNMINSRSVVMQPEVHPPENETDDMFAPFVLRSSAATPNRGRTPHNGITAPPNTAQSQLYTHLTPNNHLERPTPL